MAQSATIYNFDIELADVDLPPGTRFWAYGMGGEARAFDLRLLREDRSLLSPTIAGDRISLSLIHI